MKTDACKTCRYKLAADAFLEIITRPDDQVAPAPKAPKAKLPANRKGQRISSRYENTKPKNPSPAFATVLAWIKERGLHFTDLGKKVQDAGRMDGGYFLLGIYNRDRFTTPVARSLLAVTGLDFLAEAAKIDEERYCRRRPQATEGDSQDQQPQIH